VQDSVAISAPGKSTPSSAAMRLVALLLHNGYLI
jgi:hypothetical protein